MPYSQPVQTSEHGSTRFFIDPNVKPVQKIDEVKNVNGWNVIFEADENGKFGIIARKTLGKFGTEESTLTFSLETTDNRVPKFRPMKDRFSSGVDHHIELDDRKDRTTESYKKHEYPKREYTEGSVLTVYEFLKDICPEFEKMLGTKEIDVYVSKISEQTAQLQPPHNKLYRIVK